MQLHVIVDKVACIITATSYRLLYILCIPDSFVVDVAEVVGLVDVEGSAEDIVGVFNAGYSFPYSYLGTIYLIKFKW